MARHSSLLLLLFLSSSLSKRWTCGVWSVDYATVTMAFSHFLRAFRRCCDFCRCLRRLPLFFQRVAASRCHLEWTQKKKKGHFFYCAPTADTRTPFFFFIRVHCLYGSNQPTIKFLMNNAITTYLRFDLRQRRDFLLLRSRDNSFVRIRSVRCVCVRHRHPPKSHMRNFRARITAKAYPVSRYR